MAGLWECEKKKDENSTADNKVRGLGHRRSDAGGGEAGDGPIVDQRGGGDLSLPDLLQVV